MPGNRTAACAFETLILEYSPVLVTSSIRSQKTQLSLFDTAKFGAYRVYFELELILIRNSANRGRANGFRRGRVILTLGRVVRHKRFLDFR